VIVEK
jgi:hypothetical protein